MKKQIKNTLRNLKNKSYILSKLYIKLVQFYLYLKYKKICRENPTNDKVIVFESFLGKQYGCSPKAIYNYILTDDRFKDYTFVWAFRSARLQELGEQFTDPRTVLVKYKSGDYYRYFAMAKYWITNWRIPPYMTKKKDQILIETWHGTPLKKLVWIPRLREILWHHRKRATKCI